MIHTLRIDDRLIHGQVAVFWVNQLNITSIYVLNDKYANNTMMKMTLMLGKPAGVDMKVVTVEDGITQLNEIRNNKETILIIVGNTNDALTVATDVFGEYKINIGGIPKKEGSISVTNQVFITEEDRMNIKKMINLGYSTFVQSIPNQSPINGIELIK